MNLLAYIRKSLYRRQLEEYLKEFLPQLQGGILDIGSKNRRYDYLLRTKPTTVDIIEDKEKEVRYGDVRKLPFQSEVFESVLCIEVLEFVPGFEQKQAMSEVYRVLKQKGTLILSVPLIYKNMTDDRMRFTRPYIEELFEDFPRVDIYPIGNFYTIILDIMSSKILRIRPRLLRYLVYLPYLTLLLFVPLSHISKDHDYASGYIIKAVK